MKRNLIVTFFAFAIISLIIVAGCASSPTPVPTYVPPAQCNSVYVVSNDFWAYGSIYINGMGTGEYLPAYGAVTVNVPNLQCGQVVTVYLIDQAGWVSHNEVVTATSPQTIVRFDYF
jgi:hypothetical protein